MYNALDIESFEKSDIFFKSKYQCGLVPVNIPCSEARKSVWQKHEPMSERIAKAKEVVRRHGFSPENPLEASLLVTNSIRGYSEISNFVKSSWHEIGINIEIINIHGYKEAVEAFTTGKYDLIVNSFYQFAPHMYIARPDIVGGGNFRHMPSRIELYDLISVISRSSEADYEQRILDAEKQLMNLMTTIPIATDLQIGMYEDWIEPNQINMPKIQLRYFTAK